MEEKKKKKRASLTACIGNLDRKTPKLSCCAVSAASDCRGARSRQQQSPEKKKHNEAAVIVLHAVRQHERISKQKSKKKKRTALFGDAADTCVCALFDGCKKKK